MGNYVEFESDYENVYEHLGFPFMLHTKYSYTLSCLKFQILRMQQSDARCSPQSYWRMTLNPTAARGSTTNILYRLPIRFQMHRAPGPPTYFPKVYSIHAKASISFESKRGLGVSQLASMSVDDL